MKNLLITLLFITPSLNLLAQEPMVFDYDWEKNPTLHQLSEADQKIPELVLKDKIVVEFAYNGKGELEAYKLHHVIIRVNSDDAINENNKIYLPYFNSSDMISQKARVINSKGKVINLDEDDIKESQDEESESSYKYFAVEGIDLGSEIEYYFVLRSSPNYSGNQITVQGTAPKRNVEFTLITPENLVMATKSYNNMPEPELDPTNKEQNVLTVLMDTVAGLKREEFANWDANLMYIVYKLDKNTYNNKRDLTNYGNYSELVYASIYEEPASAAMKKLKSLIKENGFNAITDEEEKIRAVEDSIKTSIRIFDLYVDQLSDLESILKDKVANDIGMLKLFTQLYTLLGIQHEIVVTCSRYDAKFDPDFESYNYLEIYLLYFPGTGKYMYPGGQFSRLGYIDYDYTHNYGLFIKEVEVGDYKSGVGKIKFIDALSHDVSKDDLYVEVDLNEDITNPVYKIHREQTGS